jgi:hypothetical protein
MEKIIEGVRYDTDKATELASDRYWDGNNWERGGRNCYLYKTGKGRFFKHCTTIWQGERDNIVPLTRDEAMALYESLLEHEVSYEDAFGVEPEEA